MSKESPSRSRGSSAPPAGAAPPATIWAQLAHMALWKQALLGLSVLLMGVGLVVPLLTRNDLTAGAATGGGDVAAVTTDATLPGLQPGGFAPTSDDPASDPASADSAADSDGASGSSVLSPTLFRLGFSFFVGFAIAFALRSFVKVSIAVIGVFLLLIFGLEYAGLVEVRWAALSEHYDSMAGWMEAEFSSFRSFVTGRLPAGGSAVAGMGVGFTRK